MLCHSNSFVLFSDSICSQFWNMPVSNSIRKCQFKKKQNRNPENPETPPNQKTMAILRRHLCQTSSPVKFENHPGIERFQPQKLGPNSPTPSDPTKRNAWKLFRGKMAEYAVVFERLICITTTIQDTPSFFTEPCWWKRTHPPKRHQCRSSCTQIC